MPQKKSDDLLPELSKVRFPTDAVTMAQVRRDQPELIYSDKELLNPYRRITNVHILETMRTEHILASKAWAKAIGLADPFPTHHRREEIGFLIDDYQRYGLSTGANQTKELIRVFEKEAAHQAKLAAGQGRG